jgi:hypothetical protein
MPIPRRTARLTLGLIAFLALDSVLQAGGVRQPSDVLWFFFIDDLHVQFTDTGRVRDQLRTMVGSLFQEGDLVGAASTGPSSIEVDLTNDRERVERAFTRMSGAALQAADLFRLSRQPSSQPDERSYRAEVALMTALDIAKNLEHVQHPRKALVYLTNGYEIPETQERFAAVTAQATRSNVKIFALGTGWPTEETRRLDPNIPDEWWRNYVAATERSLSLLSQRSGGFAVLRNTALASDLTRIAKAMRP